jgi:hypothetical protein
MNAFISPTLGDWNSRFRRFFPFWHVALLQVFTSELCISQRPTRRLWGSAAHDFMVLLLARFPSLVIPFLPPHLHQDRRLRNWNSWFHGFLLFIVPSFRYTAFLLFSVPSFRYIPFSTSHDYITTDAETLRVCNSCFRGPSPFQWASRLQVFRVQLFIITRTDVQTRREWNSWFHVPSPFQCASLQVYSISNFSFII